MGGVWCHCATISGGEKGQHVQHSKKGWFVASAPGTGICWRAGGCPAKLPSVGEQCSAKSNVNQEIER